MSAHTPGPWNQHIDRGVKQTTVVAAGNKLVAVALWDANEQWQHNARLIAAAPDLLEALYDMLEDGDATDRQKALAAIAKATGGQA